MAAARPLKGHLLAGCLAIGILAPLAVAAPTDAAAQQAPAPGEIIPSPVKASPKPPTRQAKKPAAKSETKPAQVNLGGASSAGEQPGPATKPKPQSRKPQAAAAEPSDAPEQAKAGKPARNTQKPVAKTATAPGKAEGPQPDGSASPNPDSIAAAPGAASRKPRIAPAQTAAPAPNAEGEGQQAAEPKAGTASPAVPSATPKKAVSLQSQPVDSPIPLVRKKAARAKSEPLPESLLEIELASFPMPPVRPLIDGTGADEAQPPQAPVLTQTGSIPLQPYAPLSPQGNAPPPAFSRDDVEALIVRNAGLYKVPESLLRRIVARESGGNPRVRNGPYIGLMQMRLETARGMGYQGSAEGLLDANINITYGAAYLANAYKVAEGNQDNAVRLYASGYYYEAKRKGLLPKLIKAAPHK